MSHRQLRTPERRLSAAKRDLGLPVIVAICGSTRFMAQMNEAELRETFAGRIVVKPACDLKYPHPLWADPARVERLKADLDELHRAKIRLADEVLIVGDYVGDSTRSEIRYARALGKPVRFTHPEADPNPSPLPAATYEIALNGVQGGTISLAAVEPVPGLHVYELPVEHREEGDGVSNPWRLGHHSGRVLAAFPSEDDALRAAREVADLADWTRPAEDLSTNGDLDLDEYVDRIETRTNGLLITPQTKTAR